jgi:hypothetical protein
MFFRQSMYNRHVLAESENIMLSFCYFYSVYIHIDGYHKFQFKLKKQQPKLKNQPAKFPFIISIHRASHNAQLRQIAKRTKSEGRLDQGNCFQVRSFLPQVVPSMSMLAQSASPCTFWRHTMNGNEQSSQVAEAICSTKLASNPPVDLAVCTCMY